MIEDWKMVLEKQQTTGAIFIDLSKAFDCYSHSLLLDKLKNYGLSDSAIKLMSSYLSNCFQILKIGENVSKWGRVKCGVPQGSLIGPCIFNIFINDLFHILEYCILYNYADDNTASHSSDDVEELVCELESELRNILKWFKTNCLGTNPDKLQCIALGKDASKVKISIEDRNIYPSNDVKVLGATIDKDLKFYKHVSDICCKAAKQINVLFKLLSVLDQEA